VETYATVFAIAPSYHDSQVLWAGSDDGYVQVTRDGGGSWRNVTPPDAPDFVRINTIEASPTTPGKAYVAGIRYLVENDRSPYVWKTEDYGATWSRIDADLPRDDFVRAVREDPDRPGLLYAASERTVYVSFDDGSHWMPLTLNLPTVQVADLVVEGRDLVIATHGRSFWVLSGIDRFRQLTPEVLGADAWLFDPFDPVRGLDQTVDVAYYLSKEAGAVTVEFANDQGEVLQTFSGTSEDEEEEPAAEEAEEPSFRRGGGTPRASTRAGTNTLRWNMRLEGYTDFDGRIFWAAGNVGPAVVPGRYTVRLSVDGQEVATRDFVIGMDPRIEGVTVEDLQARFDLATRIRDRTSEANEAVIRIREIKTQIDGRVEEAGDQGLAAAGEDLKAALSAVEGEIYQVRNQSNQDPLNFPIKLNNKLAALLGVVEGSENRPTDQSYEVFDYLSRLLDAELGRLQEILDGDMAAFNRRLVGAGLEAIQIRGEV
jgi:hypothetical protein